MIVWSEEHGARHLSTDIRQRMEAETSSVDSTTYQPKASYLIRIMARRRGSVHDENEVLEL